MILLLLFLFPFLQLWFIRSKWFTSSRAFEYVLCNHATFNTMRRSIRYLIFFICVFFGYVIIRGKRDGKDRENE